MSKYTVDEVSGCMLWTASFDRFGRPSFWDGNKSVDARTWMLTQNGRSPGAGHLMYHDASRDDRYCVNPEHWVDDGKVKRLNGVRYFASRDGLDEQYGLDGRWDDLTDSDEVRVALAWASGVSA